MLKIVIAEKAIAAKSIAAILAGRDVPQTNISGSPAFRFNLGPDEWVVFPLRGHITDVEFPKKYSYWVGTDLRMLADAEVLYTGTEAAIIAGLKSASGAANEIIVATDADREGESIGVEALNYVKLANPKVKVQRAYFSAITKKDLDEAFSKLALVDYNLADSADSRREIDLIWGAVLTRFLSLVSGKLGHDYLSVGRVQTPTLALVVRREKERLAFVSKKYWELKAVFEKKKRFEAEHKKGKFWEKSEADAAMPAREEFGVVREIKGSKRVLKKPTPFNTTDFLRQATSIGFSAVQAMDIAERLYQQGYTSYPRTDNTVYPDSLDLRATLREVSKVDEFRKEAEILLAKKILAPSKGSKQTKDHPPIYPVGAVQKIKLNDQEWKIYELITRRFMATLADDAITENLTVDISIGKEPFVAHGQKIADAGWKSFYPYSELTEVILPPLEVGEKVRLESLQMQEKQTEPPARYSESALIKLMEDLNLGTKSTRHTIIQKLYARKYLSGSKAIEPNKIAFAVIDSLERYNVEAVKPDMTAELEKEMDSIAGGKKTKKEVVEASRKFLHIVLDKLIANKDSIGIELRTAFREDTIIGKCDKCDGQLRMLMSRNKKRFLGCTNYPKCTNTYPLPQKGKISPANKLCPTCSRPVIKVMGQRMRFEMCVNMDCPTKDEWKARSAKKAEELAAKKPVAAPSAPGPVAGRAGSGPKIIVKKAPSKKQ